MGIVIEDLSFSYGDFIILDAINLTVKTGESVGVIGASGSGKSTLLKLISGLYDIKNGRISVMGCDSPAARRKNTAVVMQLNALFPASIRDNIVCGCDMDDEHIRRAVETAQLTEWVSSLPDGVDSFVGERGAQVSGGQAQRIAIARAVAKDAPVVLLDEPASALDDDTSAALFSALAKLTRNKTVVHVSHRLDTLSGCDRIFTLDGGRLHAR